MSVKPLHDVRAEGERIVRAAEREGLTARLCGGAAVAHLCPSAGRPPLARAYKDVDLVALRRERNAIAELVAGLGYEPRDEFNLLSGGSRLLFWDPGNARQLDVMLDRFEMCHTLELAGRLRVTRITLDPADLLLTKLQVRETNDRDVKDALALLLDTAPDVDRIVTVLCDDWGWWRTATEVLRRVAAAVPILDPADADLARDRIDTLERELAARPKTRRWRARALLGDRIRWYEEPVEEY